MNIEILTPPPEEPVELLDVYDQLRLTPIGTPPTHPQDRMLTRHRASAREVVEKIMGRSLVERTLRLYHDGFPRDRGRYDSDLWHFAYGYGWVELPRPPIIEVLSVSYFDADNNAVVISADDYFVTSEDLPRITFTSGYAMPVTYARNDAFVIEYRAGYEAGAGSPPEYAANIPETIKQALLIQVELFYNKLDPRDRETMENARDNLLSPYVVHSIA